MTIPVCACHGERMYWQKDRRCTVAGGYWHCAAKRKQRGRDQYANRPEVRLDRQLRNLSRIRVVN